LKILVSGLPQRECVLAREIFGCQPRLPRLQDASPMLWARIRCGFSGPRFTCFRHLPKWDRLKYRSHESRRPLFCLLTNSSLIH